MAKMTFTEWLEKKYGIEGADLTDMYEADPEACDELEDEYYNEDWETLVMYNAGWETAEEED